MGDFTVHYQNDIWDGRPMADPCTCRHPGMMAFPIGMTIDHSRRGAGVICVEADICMDCGSDRTGQVGLVEGLTLAYQPDHSEGSMNAPHSTRVDDARPVQIDMSSYERGVASGRLCAGVSALDQATYALEAAIWQIETAVRAGATSAYGLDRLCEIAGRISDVALKAETATSRIIAMSGGAS